MRKEKKEKGSCINVAVHTRYNNNNSFICAMNRKIF